MIEVPEVPWTCPECDRVQETPADRLSWSPARPHSVEIECEGCHCAFILPHGPAVEAAKAHGIVSGLRDSEEARSLNHWCARTFEVWADAEIARMRHPSWNGTEELQRWT